MPPSKLDFFGKGFLSHILLGPFLVQKFTRFALYGRREGFVSLSGALASELFGTFQVSSLMCGRGFFHVPSQDNLDHLKRSTFRESRQLCPGEIEMAP